MDEMERIKPGINAEADAFRLSLPKAPSSRPPPLGAATGVGSGASEVGSVGSGAEQGAHRCTPAPVPRPPPVPGLASTAVAAPHLVTALAREQSGGGVGVPVHAGAVGAAGGVDLLSASPEEMAAAAQVSLSALGLAGAHREGPAANIERYRPQKEFISNTKAIGGAASKHSFLGGKQLPSVSPVASAAPPRTIHGQTTFSLSAAADAVESSAVTDAPYPTINTTRAAVPEVCANLAVPPPPPSGAPPSQSQTRTQPVAAPSAPPMPPQQQRQQSTYPGVSVPSYQPPPPPGPPPPPPPPLPAGFQAPAAIVSSAASRELQPKRIASVPARAVADNDHNRLTNRLLTYGLKEKKVRGDGNCQFRAIADQLFRDQERHAECRAAVVQQLQRERDHYSVFVPENYDAYVAEMARETSWGDHITLQAAADAYGVGMCIISTYKDNFVIEIIPRVKRSERVLWISFWAEVHYNSIYHINAHI